MTKKEIVLLLVSFAAGLGIAFAVGRLSVADEGQLLAAYARCRETGGQWSEGSDYYRCRTAGEMSYYGVGR